MLACWLASLGATWYSYGDGWHLKAWAFVLHSPFVRAEQAQPVPLRAFSFKAH
jgi:hypothetical protein